MATKTTAKAVMGVRVLPCTCKSEFQDAKYGPGKRVHNIGTKFMTCTVCAYKRTV